MRTAPPKPAAFPKLVAPQVPLPPFLSLRAIRHAAGEDGRMLEIRFEGDVFELEDQRNWSDGSFKTFCTPLALSFPRQINAGDRICQKVSLRLNEPRDVAGPPASLCRPTRMPQPAVR